MMINVEGKLYAPRYDMTKHDIFCQKNCYVFQQWKMKEKGANVKQYMYILCICVKCDIFALCIGRRMAYKL